jgi:uncharacterized protein (DUF433 family)
MNEWKDRIIRNPEVMVGKPIVKGTRITVEFILDRLSAEGSMEKVLSDYPHLTREDILAALAYARDALSTDEVILAPASGQ